MAATWYEKELKNKNFLAPIGFKLTLEKAPKAAFLCQTANIPTIQVGEIDIPTRGLVQYPIDGNIKYGVLDSSLWHKRGDTGPSLAEQMISRGCRWRPSDRSRGSRVAGKNEIHRRLQIDEFTEEPRLVFFDTCTNLTAQLPSIPLDKKNPEDIDTQSEDHLYDALRYGIMSRPRFSIFDYDPMGRPSTGMRVADSTFGY